MNNNDSTAQQPDTPATPPPPGHDQDDSSSNNAGQTGLGGDLFNLRWDNHSPTIIDNFWNLLNNNDLTDCTLVTRDINCILLPWK